MNEKTIPDISNSNSNQEISSIPLSGLTVLVVEDNVSNFVLLARMLGYLGIHCEWKTSGYEVVEFANTLPKLDLILMDIQMPLMDGIAATQELRTRYSELPPIIGLSANAFEGDREKYIARGMDDYLTKPVKTEDFATLINRLFAQKT